MTRPFQLLAVAFSALLCVAAKSSPDVKGAYYYDGSDLFFVVARDYGTTLAIKQYSRVMEKPPSERFVIRTQQYYLDLDGSGRGLLRKYPGGQACGMWILTRSGNFLTLSREGVHPPPKTAPVTKANYFDRPFLMLPSDPRGNQNGIAGLESTNSEVNQWRAAGGKLTNTERENYAYYADWFRC